MFSFKPGTVMQGSAPYSLQADLGLQWHVAKVGGTFHGRLPSDSGETSRETTQHLPAYKLGWVILAYSQNKGFLPLAWSNTTYPINKNSNSRLPLPKERPPHQATLPLAPWILYSWQLQFNRGCKMMEEAGRSLLIGALTCKVGDEVDIVTLRSRHEILPPAPPSYCQTVLFHQYLNSMVSLLSTDYLMQQHVVRI